MIIKVLYLTITGVLMGVSFLSSKIFNLSLAFKLVLLSVAWCFGTFGVSLSFSVGELVPPTMLFFIATIPLISVICWIIFKME